MGTSLKVYPFAGLVNMVDRRVPRILINRECPEAFQSDRTTDVTLLGDIQEIVIELIDLLGWRDEFEALKKSYQQTNTNTTTTPKE